VIQVGGSKRRGHGDLLRAPGACHGRIGTVLQGRRGAVPPVGSGHLRGLSDADHGVYISVGIEGRRASRCCCGLLLTVFWPVAPRLGDAGGGRGDRFAHRWQLRGDYAVEYQAHVGLLFRFPMWDTSCSASWLRPPSAQGFMTGMKGRRILFVRVWIHDHRQRSPW